MYEQYKVFVITDAITIFILRVKISISIALDMRKVILIHCFDKTVILYYDVMYCDISNPNYVVWCQLSLVIKFLPILDIYI